MELQDVDIQGGYLTEEAREIKDIDIEWSRLAEKARAPNRLPTAPGSWTPAFVVTICLLGVLCVVAICRFTEGPAWE